jgi:hypothetical protein
MHSEIYRIAYQLNAEGKTPSVALIRARLSTPTSLPVIIQALQKWKLTPELGKEVGAAEESQSQTTACEADSSIEQRLKVLEQKVDKILVLLQEKS